MNTREYPLSDKYIKLWSIRAAAILVLFTFVCGAIAAFSVRAALLAECAALLFYVLTVTVYLRLLYRECRYIVREDGIIIHKGVFLRRRLYVSRSRVQYAEMSQTPLQRLMRICTVRYQVAGGVVSVGQIDTARAREIMF